MKTHHPIGLSSQDLRQRRTQTIQKLSHRKVKDKPWLQEQLEWCKAVKQRQQERKQWHVF